MGTFISAALALCAAQSMKAATFRADARCYPKNTLQYLENQNITYYIRAEKNEGLCIALEDENQWQPAGSSSAFS